MTSYQMIYTHNLVLTFKTPNPDFTGKTRLYTLDVPVDNKKEILRTPIHVESCKIKFFLP